MYLATAMICFISYVVLAWNNIYLKRTLVSRLVSRLISAHSIAAYVIIDSNSKSLGFNPKVCINWNNQCNCCFCWMPFSK